MLSTFLIKKSNFIFKKLGIQLTKRNLGEEKKFKWLSNFQIDTIIDVGANEGQFARKILGAIELKTIYCFEPTSIAFNKLLENTSKNPKVKLFNLGLGDSNKQVEININSFSPSSSILQLSNYHKSSYPKFLETKQEMIEVKTLDSLVANNEIRLSNATMLKIDVQGFERFVLEGALQSLKTIKLVYLEISFIEMYQSQPLFKEIYDFLTLHGFTLIGAENVAIDQNNGQPLFFDAYFIKN